jgi:Protein of unknown function (DUF2985)
MIAADAPVNEVASATKEVERDMSETKFVTGHDPEEGRIVASSALMTADSLHSLAEQGKGTEEASVSVSARRIQSLEPPLSSSEEFRDAILRFLDHPFFQTLGIIVLVLIILSGAFFFFLLLGWQAMCDTPSRTDCEPRNTCFNISIQILNGLFTYMAVESMPWRCTQFLHVAGWTRPYRRNDIGHDLFGLPSQEIWYHIPQSRRIGICLCLLLNCLTQFANQATRIIFPTFEQADTSPGNIWTNIFFVSSMLFAAVGGVWMLYEEHIIHKQQPNTFAPSAIMLLKEYVRRHCVKQYVCTCCHCCKMLPTEINDDDLQGNSKDNNHHLCPAMVEPPDHISTPHHEHVLPVERTNARLWAL